MRRRRPPEPRSRSSPPAWSPGAAIGFVVAEWNRGAQEFGRYEAADPCAAPPDTYPGDGLDATVQRIALGGSERGGL